MDMICEKCGKSILVSQGEFLFYQGRMAYACAECANILNDETKCALKICAAIDSKKKFAENVVNDRNEFDKFLKNIEKTMKKLPEERGVLSDIPLLVSLVKSFVTGEYTSISYNTIIAIIATLLYVISPIDIIPDFIPAIGFSDDMMAVAFCVKMAKEDIEKYEEWRKQMYQKM